MGIIYHREHLKKREYLGHTINFKTRKHFKDKARRLTHECCNYCNGNCLLLDDGEECVCVQSISYSLLCRWFQAAVLPLDAALYAEIIKDRDEVKRCCECGATFQPKSNRAKYCAACAKRMRRRKEAERQRKDTGSTKHKKRRRTQAATSPSLI